MTTATPFPYSPVAVVTPTFPERSSTMIARAAASVHRQQYPALTHIVVTDIHEDGAGPTRQRGIDTALGDARIEYIAFLDDDDELMPNHLAVLVAAAREHDADVVWPWFQVIGGNDPFPQHEGRQWQHDDPHSFPITAIVRADTLIGTGVRFGRGHVDGPMAGEDLPFWTELLNSPGVVGHHVPMRTWLWYHHGRNTSGQPHRR
jgi:hypothetical protein